MAWVAVDLDGTEVVYDKKPIRGKDKWGAVSSLTSTFSNDDFFDFVVLPRGSIKKLIGRELNWSSEPFELV